MDDNELSLIYADLPDLRKEVLNRFLMGYSTKQISNELFIDNRSPISSVQGHLKEIYKNYEYFLINSDSESKRSHLIILFYTYLPALVSKLKIELGSPISLRNKPQQFGTLVNEYEFELYKVSLHEITMLQSMGRQYFGSQDHLPTKLLKDWYKKDENSFRMIKNKNGRIVGFFIILFIKAMTFRLFANGSIIEKDLKYSKIISSTEPLKDNEKHCYISLVVGDDRRYSNNICILLCLAKYLDKVRKHRKFEKVYGMAATESGNKLMQKTFNFHIYTSSIERIDKENFLELDISELDVDFFDYLINKEPGFRDQVPKLFFDNEDDWMPVYPALNKDN
jgi:hypothetical protein